MADSTATHLDTLRFAEGRLHSRQGITSHTGTLETRKIDSLAKSMPRLVGR